MFLPVEVSNESATTAEMAIAYPDLIEIVLGDGRCVRVGAGFDADADALSRVLDVLGRR